MEKVKNTIITLSDKITIINPKDNKATETDVSTVLFNIMNSDEYRNYKEKGENISGVDKWNYIHSGIPKVNYSGVIKNNCFLSYSNMVAVTVPNFCNGYLADGNETRDEFAKKIPFVWQLMLIFTTNVHYLFASTTIQIQASTRHFAHILKKK